jgi:hypothetical protein
MHMVGRADDPADSIAAVEAWMKEPAEVLPCRAALKWPVEAEPKPKHN